MPTLCSAADVVHPGHREPATREVGVGVTISLGVCAVSGSLQCMFYVAGPGVCRIFFAANR